MKRAVPHLTPAQGSSAVVDESNCLVYGILPGMADVLPLFATTEGGSLIFTPAANGGGTGSTITLNDKYGDAVDMFTLIVFGDVNGDVWYDGTDAYLVSLVANGLVSASALTDAQRMAADCNHDGTIDSADVTRLEQAGLLLAQVDQTLPADELETNSAYLEYCGMIDQSLEVAEPAEEDPQQPTQAAASVWQIILELFNRLVSFVTMIFSIIVLPK